MMKRDNPGKDQVTQRRAAWRSALVLGGLLAGACFPAGATGEVYSGVGAHGVRWFSDVRPPEGTAYRIVPLAPPPIVEASVDGETPDTSADKKSSLTPRRVTAKTSVSPGPKAQRRADRQEAALIKRCSGYDTALRKLQAERRAGYTAAQDRAMRQRRKALQEKQFTECARINGWR